MSESCLARVADVDADHRREWLIADTLYQAAEAPVELRGPHAVCGVIRQIQLLAPVECLSVSPAVNAGMVVNTRPEDRQPIIDLMQSGADQRWVADSSTLRAAPMRRHMEILAGHGEQIRTLPQVSQRMFIFDRKIAFIPLDPHEHAKGALMVQSPPVVACLVSLFLELESHAKPLALTPLLPQPARSILSLLAAGAKDDAIARKLDISPRTVRRSVAALMQEAGADSRFQLAITATERGWLSPTEVRPEPALAAPDRWRST